MGPDSPIPPYTIDDDLVAGCRENGRPVVRVYRPGSPCVVLGASCRAEVEVDLDACAAAEIPVRRRAGGGCAVLLDPGDVIVAAAYRARGFVGSARHFARISGWLLAGLAQLGITPAGVQGGSDLALGERKFAGACIHRAGGVLHYSASLLVAPDLDLMERLLRIPPRTPAYRRGRSHQDFVAPLGAVFAGVTAPWLESQLRDVLDPAQLTATSE